MKRTYDVIVVGSGHNGLTCAAYLAAGGLDVCVLERRDIAGGATVTEELIPGFRLSTASYSLSLMRPDVYEDLDLARHGLSFYPKDPQLFVPLPDGRHFFIWRDAEKTYREIARIHEPDVEGYKRFSAFWEEAVHKLRPMIEAADPPTIGEVESQLGTDMFELAVAGSVATNVEYFFESEPLQGAFASQGIIGTMSGPRDPGTAWVMAYHFIGGELNDAWGTWAYARGGMGEVSRSLRAAAEEAGAAIILSSEVDSMIVEGGKVAGVLLTDGTAVGAKVVVSNAHPSITFGFVPADLVPDEIHEKLKGWRTEGSVVKVNMALDGLPDYSVLPGNSPSEQHLGTLEISPSIGYLEAAWEQSAHGRYPDRPFMEVFIQSASDPTLAPEGKHVLSAFTQYAPVDNQIDKADVVTKVLSTIGAHAPNVTDIVLATEVLGPRDLEDRFALVGGNIFHGEILPEQSFAARFPYRTGVDGLYLCGSGASPGGGVMAAAGRNCARIVLSDW
ncbi:MAG: phytoene desaturase family protein [Actinomycetota bacterium]|nr:NAD(P)/FAD-dependent oxidoreductase [Actinomycetota bacterium]